MFFAISYLTFLEIYYLTLYIFPKLMDWKSTEFSSEWRI
jgi:hypothetical protein